MSIINKLKVLKNILFSSVRSSEHAVRLEEFYKHQAEGYDETRENFLHGKREIAEFIKDNLDCKGKIFVDIGGGTGRNIELLGDKVADFKEIIIYDLSPSLLAQAEKRIEKNGWNNVRTYLGDACCFDIDADVILFSYSLTMIPNWFEALERAYRKLNKGGHLCAVDFYVSQKWPPTGFEKHSFFRRCLYPIFYTIDNVFLNKDHLPWLSNRTDTIYKKEFYGRIPLFPFYKSSHYIYVGKKYSDKVIKA